MVRFTFVGSAWVTYPACCVPHLKEITKQVPKILANVGQHAVIELGIGVGQLAIRVVVAVTVRKSIVLKPLHLGQWLWWNLDSKLEFNQFPEVSVPSPLKSSAENSWVTVNQCLKLLELRKKTSYVAISDFIIVPHKLHLDGTQKRF